jgi:hypothetical protein
MASAGARSTLQDWRFAHSLAAGGERVPDTHNPVVLNLMVAAPTLLLAICLLTGSVPGRSSWFSRADAPVLYWSMIGFLAMCAAGLWIILGPAVIATDWPQG